MTALSLMVKARKIKQIDLAKKLGVSKAAVSIQLKSGAKTLRTAVRYSEVLNCNPLLLLDGIGIEGKPRVFKPEDHSGLNLHR